MATKDEAEALEVLAEFPGVFDILSDRKKVICKLTKHEIPLKVQALQSYIKGKKFQRLYQKAKSPANVVSKLEDKYKDFFTKSRRGKSRLFCSLTRKEINNIPHEIEDHITGYRFLKAKFRKKEEGEQEEAASNVENKEESGIDEDEQDESDIPNFALSSDDEETEEVTDTGENESTKINKIDTHLIADDDDNIVLEKMEEDDLPQEKLPQHSDANSSKKKKRKTGHDNSSDIQSKELKIKHRSKRQKAN